MAVNLKDDYEKLAKLLYPSIEASGNVYYGQTRKLTLDEILKKSDCGFKSYIQSHREPDDSPQGFKYTSTLEWKLGPISGSIPFNPDMYDSGADGLRYTFDNFPDINTVELINFYDDEENCTIYPQSEYDGSDTNVKHLYREYLDGVLFAKYILEIENNTISNLIGSGNFKTYEKDITAVFQGICCTDFFDPTNPSNRNVGDRRFYITEVDGQVYLYIQICSDGIELEVSAAAYVPQPLTLKAAHGDFNFRLEAQYDASDLGPAYDLDGVYEYSINNGSWQTIESFHREEVWGAYWTVSDYISLSEGDTISLRGSWREIYDYSHYVTIAMYSDDPNPLFEANGNITSMYEGYDTASGQDVQGIYAGLFEGCNTLVKAPKIPVTKYVQPYMFYRTFAYCANLHEMPLLLSNETNSHCYESMFANCTALRETSVMSFLPSNSFCDSMFSGCTQLNKVICYSYDPYEMFDYSGWLNNTASVGEFFTINENAWAAGAGGIPSDWSVYEEPSYRRSMIYYTSLELDSDSNGTVLSTGTDSQENGRGIISDESTLYDMEESFNENDSHNMGTFNKDGSYNQDIWGYKSFNSPVQFRNGIYGDNFSLVAYSDENTGLTGVKLNNNLFVEGVCMPVFSSSEIDESTVEVPIGATVMLCLDSQYLYDEDINKNIPLTFKADSGDITVTADNFTGDLFYKRDLNDSSWESWAAGASVTIERNHTIMVGASSGPGSPALSSTVSMSSSGVFSATGTGFLVAYGNINSLASRDNFNNTLIDSGLKKGLFKECNKLITAPLLPCTTLSGSSYKWMFKGCSLLKLPPKLPAVFVSNNMYSYMFADCTSLEISPLILLDNIDDLAAGETSNSQAFSYMFDGCSNLKRIYCNISQGTYEQIIFDNWVKDVNNDGVFFGTSWAGVSFIKPQGTGWVQQTATNPLNRYTSGHVSLQVGTEFGLYDLFYTTSTKMYQIHNITAAGYDSGTNQYKHMSNILSIDSSFRFKAVSGALYGGTDPNRYIYVLAMRVK